MTEVVSEFSLDREDSALSCLVGRVETAHKSLTSELSLDNQNSAISRLQLILNGHHERQMEVANKLAESLNVAISALQGRKEEAAKSTRHGIEFERSVGDVIRSIASVAGDVVQDCGSGTGVISNCKVGDFLITVGPEKIAAGSKIVIEAKESAAYDLTKTLAEADMAKRNRAAGVCVFVHSEKTAPASIPSFARYGHDIVVRWDVDNEASDVWLKAAMMLATALSVRAIQHDKNEAASFQIVDRAIEGIRKQMEGFDDISTYATTSGKAAASILKRTEIMKEQMISKVEALCVQIEKLKLSSAAGE